MSESEHKPWNEIEIDRHTDIDNVLERERK